jgi:hypothetical protein
MNKTARAGSIPLPIHPKFIGNSSPSVLVGVMMQRKDSRESGEHGSFKLTNKVKATITFAVITFVTTPFGLDLDKQTETLIT